MQAMPVIITCERCGIEWEVNISRKYNNNICASCRSRRVQTIKSKFGICLPWHGYYAPDQITPVDEDGNPIAIGERLCGNLDCVQPSHIKNDRPTN